MMSLRGAVVPGMILNFEMLTHFMAIHSKSRPGQVCDEAASRPREFGNCFALWVRNDRIEL